MFLFRFGATAGAAAASRTVAFCLFHSCRAPSKQCVLVWPARKFSSYLGEAVRRNLPSLPRNGEEKVSKRGGDGYCWSSCFSACDDPRFANQQILFLNTCKGEKLDVLLVLCKHLAFVFGQPAHKRTLTHAHTHTHSLTRGELSRTTIFVRNYARVKYHTATKRWKRPMMNRPTTPFGFTAEQLVFL